MKNRTSTRSASIAAAIAVTTVLTGFAVTGIAGADTTTTTTTTQSTAVTTTAPAPTGAIVTSGTIQVGCPVYIQAAVSGTYSWVGIHDLTTGDSLSSASAFTSWTPTVAGPHTLQATVVTNDPALTSYTLPTLTVTVAAAGARPCTVPTSPVPTTTTVPTTTATVPTTAAVPTTTARPTTTTAPMTVSMTPWPFSLPLSGS